MATLLPESHGRHVTKVRISEAIVKTIAAPEEIVSILAWLLVELILVQLFGVYERLLRESILSTDFLKTRTFMFPKTHKQRKAKKHRGREANERREREANKRRSTLKRIEFVEANCKLLKKHHAICEEANQPLSTLEDKTTRRLLKKFYVNHKEANPRRSTLQQVQFAKALRKLLKKCHAIWKKTYKPLSTPLMTKICNAKLKTWLENNTVQQMHTAPAPGAPCDDGNCVPPSTQMPEALPSNDPAPVGGSSDDDPNGIESQSDESSRSTEASPAHPPDITPSSNGASPPVREDDSEHREPPVPRDIESQRDGNRDSEAIPKEALLMFALQAVQVLSNMKSNDVSLLSRKAEILQYCAEALTVVGFFCALAVILLRNQRNLRAATKIMSRIGFYITVLGFIATLCVPLGKFMFWILGFIGFLFSALYAFALWKGWIV